MKLVVPALNLPSVFYDGLIRGNQSRQRQRSSGSQIHSPYSGAMKGRPAADPQHVSIDLTVDAELPELLCIAVPTVKTKVYDSRLSVSTSPEQREKRLHVTVDPRVRSGAD